MQSSSLSTPGQTPSYNLSGLGPNPTNPAQPSNGYPTSLTPPIPASSMPMMASGQESQRSITPTFPVPQRHGTEPVARTPPTTYSLRPIQSAPAFPVPQPSLPLLGSHLASSNVQGQDTNAAKVKVLFESLVYPDGEIPVFNKDDADSWRLICSEPVATQKRNKIGWKIWKIFGSEFLWTDAHGTLLDSHFLVVKKDTSSTGENKFIHAFRPIPVEYLNLASFDDEPEDRKHPLGFFKQIGSCVGRSPGPKKDQMHPFTVYHAAAKITRRHTIYTKSRRERNEWKTALMKAIESRKSQRDGEKLYAPQIFNDGFFKIPPRIRFNREASYTGRVACASLFSFQWELPWEPRGSQLEDYIAIGCTEGIFVSKRTERTEDYSFRKILEFNEPSSLVAIPKFNKFLVHCESTLSSYPLDKVIRASRAVQGDAAIKDLDDSEVKLNEVDEHVLFLKSGHLFERTADPNRTIDRTVVIYAVKESEKVTSHVVELKRDDATPQAPVKYQELCLPIPITEEPHDATCFVDKVAICTSKAIYFVEPMKTTNPGQAQSATNPGQAQSTTNPGQAQSTTNSGQAQSTTNPGQAQSTTNPGQAQGTTNPGQEQRPIIPSNAQCPDPEMVPRIAKEAHEKSKLPRPFRRGKDDKPKIFELMGKAIVLGMVTYERDNDFLLVYDNLGCFVDQTGKLARTDYYIEWERKATSFARRGPHLLLFSPGYIEVRNIDTGKLFRMVEVNELRLLRSGLTEGRLLVGVMTGGAEADGARTEKLVELIYHGTD